MRRAVLVLSPALAIFFGIASSECLTNDFSFRHWIALFVRRGELMRLVNRHGIYDHDVERAWRAKLFAIGAQPAEVEESAAAEQKRAALDRLIAPEKLSAAASRQAIGGNAINRELDLLRWQFGDEKSWNAALRTAAVTSRALQREIASNLRDWTWIETQIAASIAPNDVDCRRYYDAHRAAFWEPVRFRASHLFLAAPDGYPSEVIEGKRVLINTLSMRLRNGESFDALVAEFCEDEATRKRGGDLNYFSEERMLPEIFAAAQQLRPGETSTPTRSRLGFHLVRLTATLPAQQMTFEQALPEIAATLENARRPKAIDSLIATVSRKMKIARQRNQFEFEAAGSPNETATIHGTY